VFTREHFLNGFSLKAGFFDEEKPAFMKKNVLF